MLLVGENAILGATCLSNYITERVWEAKVRVPEKKQAENERSAYLDFVEEGESG